MPIDSPAGKVGSRGRKTRIRRGLVRRYGMTLVFLALVAFMLATKSQFGTYQNISNVLAQNSIIGIIACGMTFAIILGGFDLSVGAVAALSSVVGATLMIDMDVLSIPIGIAGALFACLLVGAVNGWLIAYIGVNPFVSTLGTMTVVRGLIYVATNATPQAALGYELTAIAAVIVGGAALGGGSGRMWGTIVGVFLLGVIANALNLFGVSPFWQPVATGLILIVAVGLDGYSGRGEFSSR